MAKWRGDLRGGATVRDLMLWNSGDLEQQIQQLHLGEDGAIVLVEWAGTGELSAVLSQVHDGLVSREVVYDLASSLDRGLRKSPDVLSAYRAFHEKYAEAWTAGSSEDLALLYASDAQIRDPLRGVESNGRNDIIESRDAATRIEVAGISGLGVSGAGSAPAIYLGPADYRTDPSHAVGVFWVTDGTGCRSQVAVVWQLTDGLITNETRYHEVGSFADCATTSPPGGWWSGLMLPLPRDEVVTGVLETAGGHEVQVHNGTPLLEDLVHSGIVRFSEAGLDEPMFDTLTFEPSRRCTERSGRLVQEDGTRHLFLCFYENDLCRGVQPCAGPSLNVRAAVLHELAHAWMLDQLSRDTRDRLLELRQFQTWDSEDVAWPERGVEYSADVIAWGLLEETAPMARIGRPPCEELTASFRLLTGTQPLRSATDCPGG